MLLYLFAVISLALNAACVEVTVEQGVLSGSQVELVTKDGFYHSFKGIPYAAPPLGKLRFKAPEPPLHWDGIRNANEHGPICIQNSLSDRSKFDNTSSEDCLYLNVYTPNVTSKSLPVMFFIHGGGNVGSSGNVNNYGPDYLVQQGVVLVTINYRLEALGFLSLDTADVPGNAAMKDQVAALKWVKKNIAVFGGDPDNITVFGQSVGGASAMYHMVSPMSKTLFKRAISMSGTSSNEWAYVYQPRRHAFILGQQLGFNTTDPKKLFEFLQSVPAEKLAGVRPVGLASEDIANKLLKAFFYMPVIEKDFGQERFLTEAPAKVLKRKEINQKEVMIGQMSAEGSVFIGALKDSIKLFSQNPELLVPWKLLLNNAADKVFQISDLVRKHYFGTKLINNDAAKELVTYYSESFYLYGIYKHIQHLLTAGITNTYVYTLSAVSDRNIYAKLGAQFNLTAATHMDDMVYLFDPKFANLPIDKNSKEYKLIQQITKLFTNFAKFGNPTPDSSTITWPVYNSSTKNSINIGDTLTVETGIYTKLAAFWDSIYSKYQQKCTLYETDTTDITDIEYTDIEYSDNEYADIE